ncbi:MAG: DedA family protein [Blastocatellia bacterium]|jgi:membrane protein DedA with SNARE-associated domain
MSGQVFGMLEQGIFWLQQAPPWGVLLLMFLIAYVENVFPPAPSDMLLVFAGTMIGFGTVDFTPALIAATSGSTVGFMSAYLLGRYFERHIIEGRIGRFLPTGSIKQVEGLFRRFGYGVIVANRFLAGTRAIVSFFAGMSRMSLPRTTLLSALSAGAWNTLLLLLGELFASNWRKMAGYLQVYSIVVTAIVLLVLLIWLWQYRRRRGLAAE